MMPKEVVLAPSRVVGLVGVYEPGSEAIAKLWERFNAEPQAYAGLPGTGRFLGVCVELEPGDDGAMRIEYLAGVELQPDAGEYTSGNLPAGYVMREVEGGRYAAFEHHGSIEGLAATMGKIWGEWARRPEVKLRSAACLEVYDERFIEGSDESVFEILVPLADAP